MIQKNSEILAADLRALESDIARIYGTGVSDRGYGQNYILHNREGTDITRDSLLVLWEMINVARRHQTGSDTGFSESYYLPSVGENITTERYSMLKSLIDQLDNNRLNYGPASMSITGNLHTSARSWTWGGPIYSEIDYTWPSENHCRWFFNSGGHLRFTFNHPSNATAQDRSWNRALARIGNVTFNHNQTTSTTDRGSAVGWIGFYNLSTSFQRIFDGTSIDDTFDFMDPRYSPGTYPLKDDFYLYMRKISNGVRLQVELREKNDGLVAAGTSVRTSVQYATRYLRNPLIVLPTCTTTIAF